jgi:hypothetical protein
MSQMDPKHPDIERLEREDRDESIIFDNMMSDDDDGQPDEATEWRDYDPDC